MCLLEVQDFGFRAKYKNPTNLNTTNLCNCKTRQILSNATNLCRPNSKPNIVDFFLSEQNPGQLDSRWALTGGKHCWQSTLFKEYRSEIFKLLKG